jgi:non-ribosomal peptide synthetase component F
LAVEPIDIPLRPVEMHNARRYSSFYMPLAVHEEGLRGSVDYLSLAYHQETVPRFVRHFCAIVTEVAADPQRRLSAFALKVSNAIG